MNIINQSIKWPPVPFQRFIGAQSVVLELDESELLLDEGEQQISKQNISAAWYRSSIQPICIAQLACITSSTQRSCGKPKEKRWLNKRWNAITWMKMAIVWVKEFDYLLIS